MTGAFNKDEFEPQRGDSAAGEAADLGSTDDAPTASGTEPFFAAEDRSASDADADVVDEREKTIISQRPVAAPEEFYKSMPLAELAAMLEGRRLDHFRVEQMIGGGGMGAVFRGRDERLDRTVAIKVIPASKRDPETLRRFRQEAQAAARLDHPNIARVYYVGESEEWNYIVFEFIDGVNIRDLVAMEGPLTVDEAVYYTRQVAEALHHAHERGVVHRDIKPSNILVTAGGIAKVVDMGLARNTALEKSTADATASGITLGTFDYISPEQARDPRDADVRSDLYSLGCSLFFMLTGHPPFPEGTALQKLLNHGSLPPPDPRGWRDDLSDQLHEIIMKLMAKQPGNRYQKPAELVNDLVLLAKIEDLPRSQSPGTLLLTPDVTQRSFLESNLPWMVAGAFLLGSTLWLQSVQAISGGFTFPEARLSEIEAEPGLEYDDGLNQPAPPENTPTLPAESSTERAGSTSEPELFEVDQVDGNPIGGPSGSPPTSVLDLPVPRLAPDGQNSFLENRVSSVSDEEPSDLVPSNIPPELPETSREPVVVSEFRPADVEADRWENSISRALDLLDRRGGQLEIELRGKIVLTKPLDLMGRNLVIRGNPETNPRIEIAPQITSQLDDWTGVIKLQDSSLGFYGIALNTSFSGPIRQRKIGLCSLEGEANLVFDGCLLTISGPRESSTSIFTVVTDEKQNASTAPFAQLNPSTPRISVTAVDTAIRGQASFMGLRINPDRPRKLSIGVTNCLFALDGIAFDVSQRVDSEDAVARDIRLVCHQSTFVTRAGFAVLDFAGPALPLLTFIRTSHFCVFSSEGSQSHVILRGSPSQGVFGGMKFLQLTGNDNAYDRGLTAVAAYVDRNGDTNTTFGFNEAAQGSWFDESGIERRIPWFDEPARSANLSQATLSDFQLQPDGFLSPGAEPSAEFPAFE